MAQPRVFVTRSIPEHGLERIRAACATEIWDDPLPPPRDALQQRVRGVDGILALLTDQIDAEVLDAAGPSLRVVSNFAVGTDNIDLVAARQRGIVVGNTPGVLTDTTADLAFALLLSAARHVVAGDRYVREGNWRTWDPQLLLGPDIYGATLGIIGFGRIGQAIARRAAGFQMRVLYVARNEVEFAGATRVDLLTLLGESDFVSVHTPLTPETHYLLDDEAFGQMKPGAVLVNTARGGIVEPRALHQALESGRLAAAALDVTDPEPIPLDDPLLSLPNLIVVPHIGSASIATRNRMAEMAALNLIAGVTGQPLPHPVV